MKYSNGEDLRIEDQVTLDERYNGVIKAIIEENQFSTEYPKEQWSYLKTGIIIDTDFGGIVHYQESDIQVEPIELKSRGKDL